MPDIKIHFLGKVVQSPVFASVGPQTQTVEDCLEALHCGAGAVEIPFHRGDNNLWDSSRRADLYEVVPSRKDARPDRFYGLISTGMNILKDDGEKYIDYTTRRLSEVRRQAPPETMVVANIGRVGYQGDGLFSWGELARRVTDAGADAITLHMQTGNIMAGGILTRNPDFLKKVMDDVRKNTSLPVIAKLPVEGCDPALAADMAWQCGCNATASTGRFIGLLPDIDTGSCELGGHIGYGGSWVLPNTCAWAARMYSAIPERPLIPGGGIDSWEDIVRVILCGGTMVQICTWTMIKGYPVITDALKRIRAWMLEHHYESLEKLRGGIAETAVPSASLWARKISRQEAPFYGIRIHPEKCTGCGGCMTNCYFGAIQKEGRQYRINPDICVGCGCCRGTCPFGAIS